jgi:hypothetical protein
MAVRVEDLIQEAGFQYLSAVLPEDAYALGVDKAGQRTEAQAAALARRGIKSGIPDGPLFWRGAAYMIEYKADKGVLTSTQRVEFPLLERAGVRISICRSVAEVHDALVSWGIGPLRHTSLTPAFRDMAWQARVAKKRAAQASTRALSLQADAELGIERPVKPTRAPWKPRAAEPSRKQVAAGNRLALAGIR